jgi:uncharacterized protein (DUF488 family)
VVAANGTPRVATIGVYGWDSESFLAALRGAGVSLVLDVRQRRGVRGREYAWANSRRLQALLAGAAVGYLHLPALAPTSQLRALQYRADDRAGVGKRSRVALAPEYIDGYTREILDPADLGAVAALLASERLAALLCVERDPAACHRSLVAARLARDYGAGVVDIVPA